ncbi:MAG: hypothetical protein ACYS99_16620, partial [Planctomycetota bacterium]
EDRDRLKVVAGLRKADEGPPRITGHRVVLESGGILRGLARDPDGTDGPLVLKTAEGERTIARGDIESIEPATLDALEVYTPSELAELWRKESPPKTPEDHVDLADRCYEVGAYAQAKRHYEEALPDVVDPARVKAVGEQLRRTKILLGAKEAVARVRRIRTLAFRKRFEEALAELAAMRKELAGEPALLELLGLDGVERSVRGARRDHLVAEAERRFFRVLDHVVRKKVREKGLAVREVMLWAQNPKGLSSEIFASLAEKLGVEEREARESFEALSRKRPRRFTFGGGTFLHPEVAAKRKKKPGRAQRPPSPDEWWRHASPSVREQFVKAWFAEFAGVLTVLRIETRSGERIVVCR